MLNITTNHAITYTNLQVYPLFYSLKIIATLVNYTSKCSKT